MPLTKSILANAAPMRSWELGCAVGHGRYLASNEPSEERHSHGQVVLEGRLRDAIRRLEAGINSHTFTTLRDALLPKLLSRQLSVARAEKKASA